MGKRGVRWDGEEKSEVGWGGEEWDGMGRKRVRWDGEERSEVGW